MGSFVRWLWKEQCQEWPSCDQRPPCLLPVPDFCWISKLKLLNRCWIDAELPKGKNNAENWTFSGLKKIYFCLVTLRWVHNLNIRAEQFYLLIQIIGNNSHKPELTCSFSSFKILFIPPSTPVETLFSILPESPIPKL